MARRAFSLLELTVVVVILATAALIAVPRVMGTSQRARLQAAAYRLAQDIEATRDRARTLGVYQTFCFSSEGYTIIERTPTTEQKASVVLADDPYRAAIGWVALKTGTELSFDGFGVPSSAACVKITNGSQAYYVTIAAGSGATAMSARTSKDEAAAVDASVTPTPIPTGISAIVPIPRVTTKVRFDTASADLNVAVTTTAVTDLLN